MSHGRPARIARPSVDHAHSVGLIDKRGHTVRRASPPDRGYFPPCADGAGAAPRAEGIHLPRLRAHDSACRHIWHYQANEGYSKGAERIGSSGTKMAAGGCARSAREPRSKPASISGQLAGFSAGSFLTKTAYLLECGQLLHIRNARRGDSGMKNVYEV